MKMKHSTWQWLVLLPAALSLAAAGSESRLVDAVTRADADVATVRALIKQGANVNAPSGDGATALHWAAHWDNKEIADVLIRAGANVNATNDLGVTPLWLAAEHGSPEMVERLLTARANPNAKLPYGETPLMVAARSGNPRAVRALITAGADVNVKERRQGQTALMWAAAKKHSEVVKVLIEAGAQVNARTDSYLETIQPAGGPFQSRRLLTEWRQGGFTPLLFAAQQGDIETAKLLLAAGANVNDTAASGQSVLVIATHAGYGELGAFLLEQGADPNLAEAGYTALHAAILRKDLDLVKALVAHGADVNAPITKPQGNPRHARDYVLGLSLVGATPFWQAASYKQLGIMRVLAANGADPLFKMKDGKTALRAVLEVRWRGSDEAQEHNPVTDEQAILEAAKFTVDLNVDVNGADALGTTPLHIAASRQFDTIIRYLTDKGANLTARNIEGKTVLAMAASDGPRRADTGQEVSTADEKKEKTAELLRSLGASQ